MANEPTFIINSTNWSPETQERIKNALKETLEQELAKEPTPDGGHQSHMSCVL